MNRQKGGPSSQHGNFYESRHGREEEGSGQGGTVSPAQREDNATTTSPRGARGEEPTVPKVTVQYSGAKRDGYFRDRDYT